MASALTAFVLGMAVAGGQFGGTEIQIHKQTWADAFACPAYVKYIYLLAVPIEYSASAFIQRVFLPYVRRLSPSLAVICRPTNV